MTEGGIGAARGAARELVRGDPGAVGLNHAIKQ